MKKLAAVLILIVFIFSISTNVLAINPLYVEPVSASFISAASYGLMDFWGISFSVSSGSSSGMESFMNELVEDYASKSGSSISEIFGGAIAVDAAGKLVIGQITYNAIKDFVSYLIDKFGLDDADSVLTPGGIDDIFVPTALSSSSKLGVVGVFTGVVEPSSKAPYANGFRNYSFTYDNRTIASGSGTSTYPYTGNWSIIFDGNVYIECEYIDGRNGDILTDRTPAIFLPLTNSIYWNGKNFVEPDILDPTKEWTGNIDGYTQPDTNIDQLIGGIFEQASVGDISIQGEITDVDIPPTPAPTYPPPAPDIPLQDVPWGGLDDAIGGATDAITDSVTDAATDIIDAVDDLTGKIESALDTPTEEELPDFKFDLRELFPFCIPFDIYRLLSIFDAEPQAPHVQLPIVIQSIGFNYTLDLDFSAWNPVAQVMRTAELVVYAIALAWATGKVIKW